MAESLVGDLARRVRENTILAWSLVLGLPPLLLALGVLVAPELVYDRFLWKHIVGPTVADANGQTTVTRNGVSAHSGYTLLSYVPYGYALITLVYAIYTGLLRRFEIRTQGAFLVGLLPLVVYGPLTRVLEDADVFLSPGGDPSPLAYAFISPWIYFQIGAYAVLFLLLGVAVERIADRTGFDPDASPPRDWLPVLAPVLLALAAVASLYTGLVYLLADGLRVVAHPAWVWGTAVLAAGVHVAGLRRWGPTIPGTAFPLGLPLVVPPLVLVGRWLTGEQWAPFRGQLFPEAAGFAFGMALAVVLGVYLAGRLLGDDSPRMAAFAGGFNLALVFGHMVDAWSTYVAIEDPLGFGIVGYGEKHPISELFLGVADGLGFPIVKFLMVVFIVYLLEGELEAIEETDEAGRNLVGLVKFAIFVLGFAPGLRSLTRVVMGT